MAIDLLGAGGYRGGVVCADPDGGRIPQTRRAAVGLARRRNDRAAVAVFVSGILQAPSHGWTNPRVFGCLVAGVALAVVFGIVEIRRQHPLPDVRLFRHPEFGTGSAAIAVVFLATFALFYLVVQYVQQVMGYSPLQTVFALSPLALPLLTFSALSSW